MSEYEKQLEDAIEKLQALVFKLSSNTNDNLIYMFKPKGDSKFVFSMARGLEKPIIFNTLKECVMFLCLKCIYVYNEFRSKEHADNILITKDSNYRSIFEYLGMKYNIYSFNLDTFEETLVFPLQDIKMDNI